MDVDTSEPQAPSDSPVENPNTIDLANPLEVWKAADAAMVFVLELIGDVLGLLAALPETEARALRQVAPAAQNLLTRARVLRTHTAHLVTFKAEANKVGLPVGDVAELHPFPVTATVGESLEQHTPRPGDVAPTYDLQNPPERGGQRSEAPPAQEENPAPVSARCWFCTRRVTKGHEDKCINCGSENPAGPNPLTRKRTA